MTEPVQIYVALLDEGVDVWRPIKAELVEGDVYRIIHQPYDRTIEAWQFEPGERVICRLIASNDGQILAAVQRAGA
ncbi:MAG TPA: hypothetical protein VFA20_17305 [Myxococcaceae bacterium]|nr:hypothetical protein [Myxococcaceae bacterium]